MILADVAVIFVLAAVIGLATVKIIREKRKGAKCATCIGCPYSGGCEKAKK